MKNKFLAKSIKLSSVLALLAVTGCAEYHRRVLDSMEAKGPEFTRTLAKEYETLGHTEQHIMYDEWSANYYYTKAIQAKNGCPVRPTPLDCWDIDSEKLPELQFARARLMRALEYGAWEAAPMMSAYAQSHFDCWVEQQAEGWQKEDIANCRAEFYEAMAEVELMLMGGVLNVPPSNMVFFDLGSAHLDAAATAQIDQIALIAATSEFAGHILLIGRTDKVGDAKHNKNLSKHRALMVKKELVRRGVSPHRIAIKAAGETPGPQVDAHNRRVDIIFLEYK